MMNPKENPFFYDLNYDKSKGVKLFFNSFIEEMRKSGYEIKFPLQYQHSDTKGFGMPKVFLLSKGNKLFKGRIVNSEEESKRIENNLVYAKQMGLPVSELVESMHSFMILSYIVEDKDLVFDNEMIREIGLLHSRLNISQVSNKNFLGKFEKMLMDCCNFCERPELYKKIKKTIPSDFYPVFDHQDFGIHNLIIHNKKPYLIDEEALGLLPFGYSLHRALNGRSGYSICNSFEEKEIYLSQFSKEKREAYFDSMLFWENFLNLRSASRAKVVGNLKLSKKLMGQIK